MDTLLRDIQKCLAQHQVPAQWTFQIGPAENPVEGAMTIKPVGENVVDCVLILDEPDKDMWSIDLSDQSHYKRNVTRLLSELAGWLVYRGNCVRSVLRML